MIQKHIDLVAEVMKDSKVNLSPKIFKEGLIRGNNFQWSESIDLMCERFAETYPLFNEAEFRKKCGA